MRVMLVVLLAGCTHTTVDTMEQCSLTQSSMMGMNIDTEINCSNREYRDSTHVQSKRYKHAVDDAILGDDDDRVQ